MSEIRETYAHGHDRPVGSFAGIMAAYLGLVGVLAAVVRRRGGCPDRVEGTDLALMAIATQKLSRVLAKDPVTSPLRAPFTTFAGTSGPAELQEEVRGSGVRKAMGELVECPFCVAQWVVTAFAFGYAIAPRVTRLVMGALSALTGADYLQFAYAKLQEMES